MVDNPYYSFRSTLLIAADRDTKAALQLNAESLAVEGRSFKTDSENLLTLSLPLLSLQLDQPGELVPSFSTTTSANYGYQFSLHTDTQKSKPRSVSLATVGNYQGSAKAETSTDQIASEIDLFKILKPVTDVSLELSISGLRQDQLLAGRWCLSLTQRSPQKPGVKANLITEVAPLELPVPHVYSQMLVPEIGPRICSPTCIAMLIPDDASPTSVASKAFCEAHDIYGAWPYALYAASTYGKLGLLSYFDTWEAVKSVLNAGYPIVASIRYGKDELAGAALERETSEPKGHLIVVRGYAGSDLIVYDPAAKSLDQVPRRYAQTDLLNVWLNRSGMGYVLL